MRPRTLLLAVIAALAASLLGSAPALAQQSLCPSDNPVVQENNCAGTGSGNWRLTNPSENIGGFSTQSSVNLGENVPLKIGRANAFSASTVNVEVYRMGYYGNNGGRLVTSQVGVPVNNTFNACGATNSITGLKGCSGWSVSYTIPGAALPASGIYTAKLTEPVSGAENSIVFTVRDDARAPKAKMLFALPTATYQAYNDWGGKSLYFDSIGGPDTISGSQRAVKVSFDRPTAHPLDNNRFYGVDFYMVQWLEKQGYDVGYTEDVALHQNPTQLLGHHVAMISGHSEYWSNEQFDGYLAARNAGVNIASFSSNTAYWKVRYEDGARTLVCYKTVQGSGSDGSGADGANDWGPDGIQGTADDALGADGIAGTADDHPENSTTTFRDNGAPNGDPNAPAGGRVGPNKPENQLFGSMYYGAELSAGAFPLAITPTNAQSEFAGDRIWRNTGISAGTTTTIGTNLVGWEWDAVPTQAQYLSTQPAGVKRLTNTTIATSSNVNWLQDEGRVYSTTPPPGQSNTTQAVKYTAASGALVFSSGTNNWANALAPNPDGRLIQATYNILSDMGVQPVTPVGLTLDPPSGPQPPTASFTVSPTSVQTGQTVTFDATGSTDLDGPIAKYEWDLDGNGTYETDTGTNPVTTHSYTSTGVLSIRLRVTDQQGDRSSTTRALSIDNSGTGNYPSRVLGTSGLIDYWRMGETSGTTLVDSVGSSNATTTGSPSLGAPGALANDTDTAVSFNGLNDAATANLGLSGTNKLTVEFWMKWNAFSNNDNLAMEFTPNFNSSAGGFLIDPNAPQSGGQFGVSIGDVGTRNNVMFTRPTAGAWHHYAFVFDTSAPAASQITPYVDGQPISYSKLASGTGAGNFANSQLYFMSRAASSLFASGSLDELAIFNRALDAQTIAAHYAGNPQPPHASFGVSADPAAVGQNVSFDGSASTSPNGNIAKYEWDLDGNGTYETDTGTNPVATRSYSSPGAVTAKLRVTDSAGKTATDQQTFTVEQPGSGTYSDRVRNTGGLIDYWRMGELTGTTLGDSKGGSPATISGGPQLGAPGAVTGDTDTSVRFNGSTSGATANLDLSSTSKLTVEFWLKWNAFANDDKLAFEFTPNFNSNPGGFLVDPNAPQEGGKFAASLGSGLSRNASYFDRPSAGAWHHYAIVFDSTAPAASQVTPYVDGQAVPYTKPVSGTGAGNFANSQLYFMSRAANSLFGAGDLDEVAIYNRALSASTIASHFGGNVQPPTASFTASPNPAQAGQTVTFNASASSAAGGTIAKYQWDLDGNGTFGTDTGTTPTVTHAYASAGSYDVKLRVTDNNGSTSETTRTVSVEQPGSGTYATRVLGTAGLTNYWRMDELTGGTLGDSKGSSPATTSGAPGLGAPGALAGGSDTGVSFNGSTDAATADLNLSGTNKLTLEFWLKWNAFADDDKLAFEFTPNFNANAGGFLVDPNAGGAGSKFAVSIGDGSTRNSVAFDRPSAGAWHHYAVVLDTSAPPETQIIPYLDGQPVAYTKLASGTGAGNFASSQLYFMSRAANSLFGAGGLDEVALYNRVLSPDTISDHYSSSLSAQPPTASFTASPNPATTGQTVTFDGSASSAAVGTIAKYQWDLDGNGTFETDTGTTPTASRSYATKGSVDVRLRVTDNNGATTTTTRAVTVGNSPPTASFTASPTSTPTGQSVTFDASASGDTDGTIAKYEWDLDGNGTYETDTGTTKTVSHSYASSGPVDVHLRVTDNDGDTTTAVRTVTVTNRAPTSSFTATPNPAQKGQTVTFNGAGSTDPDGTVAKYEWDLDGNGTYETDTGTTPTATRAYATVGNVDVKLRVTDNQGATDTLTKTVTVQSQPPTASFTVSPSPATTGQTVTVDGTASSDPDGTVAKYEWDLDGNGTYETDTGTTKTASHTYATAGAVNIGLRVTDSDGTTGTTTRSLTVQNRPPTASFTISPSPAATRQTVTFNGAASSDPDGTVAKYEWDLDGNGTYETDSGASASTTRVFNTVGPLTIGLRVTDNNGATATTTRSLTVNSAYRTAILGTAGISDYWRLDDTGTTAADANGANNNGIYTNGPTSTGALITGELNNARAFDGSNDYVNLSPNPFGTPAQLSAEAWVRTTATKANGGYHFLITDSNSEFTNGFSLVIDSTNHAMFSVARSSSVRGQATSSVTLSPNTTHHLVGTYDGSRVRIYVDGVEVGNVAFTGALTWSGGRNMFLGRPSVSTSSLYYLQGTLDEAAIYTQALPAATVQAHYNAGKP